MDTTGQNRNIPLPPSPFFVGIQLQPPGTQSLLEHSTYILPETVTESPYALTVMGSVITESANNAVAAG